MEEKCDKCDQLVLDGDTLTISLKLRWVNPLKILSLKNWVEANMVNNRSIVLEFSNKMWFMTWYLLFCEKYINPDWKRTYEWMFTIVFYRTKKTSQDSGYILRIS